MSFHGSSSSLSHGRTFQPRIASPWRSMPLPLKNIFFIQPLKPVLNFPCVIFAIFSPPPIGNKRKKHKDNTGYKSNLAHSLLFEWKIKTSTLLNILNTDKGGRLLDNFLKDYPQPSLLAKYEHWYEHCTAIAEVRGRIREFRLSFCNWVVYWWSCLHLFPRPAVQIYEIHIFPTAHSDRRDDW